MKNIKKIVSLLLVFTMSFICFAGCTKAKNASLSEVISHFTSNIAEYCYDAKDDNSLGIVEKKDGGTFIFHFKSNGNITHNLIAKTEGNNHFFILDDANEYAFMLNQATTYFYNELNILQPTLTIKQNQKLISKSLTERLWYDIDDIVSSVDRFNLKHEELATFVAHSSGEETPSNIEKLDELLTEYKNVISNLISASMTTEEICDSYISTLHENYDVMEEVSSLELDQMIQMYRLYVTNYLFQRYMLMSDDNFSRFKDEKLYKALDKVTKAYEAAKKEHKFPETSNDATVLEIYKILKQNTELLKIEAERNENTVDSLMDISEKLEIKYENFEEIARNEKFIAFMKQILNGNSTVSIKDFAKKDVNETEEEFTERLLLIKDFYVDYDAKLCSYMDLLNTLITKVSTPVEA